jgi:hypothetical protein
VVRDLAEREGDQEEAALAVDAAPWLVGGEPEEPVPAEELHELLQPLKERVAEDIRGETPDEDPS